MIKEFQEQRDLDDWYTETNREVMDSTVFDKWRITMLLDDRSDGNDLEWDTIYLRVQINLVTGNKTSRVLLLKHIGIAAICEAIDALIGKVYTLCIDCDTRLAQQKDHCNECYPYITTKEEDCCICLANEEKVWIKLTCGHQMHESCFRKANTNKCPLCRQLIEMWRSKKV